MEDFKKLIPFFNEYEKVNGEYVKKENYVEKEYIEIGLSMECVLESLEYVGKCFENIANKMEEVGMTEYVKAIEDLCKYHGLNDVTDENIEQMIEHYSNVFCDVISDHDDNWCIKMTVIAQEVMKLPQEIIKLIELMEIQDACEFDLTEYGYKYSELTDEDWDIADAAISKIEEIVKKKVE